ELGELRLAVGTEVLVAVAAGALVVALDTADHAELLEQLRRLRQRVPGAGREAGRDQEVAGTLRRGSRPRRRVDLDGLVTVQDPAGSLVDLRAQPQRRGGSGSAHVQVAVREPGLLADLLGLGQRRRDLERQRR